MKIFDPSDPKHNSPFIFCRLNKAKQAFHNLFESRCKRALNLMKEINAKNEKPEDYYEIDKALEAAIKMKGLEDTHFALVSSDSYNCMRAGQQLSFLARIHNVLPTRKLHQ